MTQKPCCSYHRFLSDIEEKQERYSIEISRERKNGTVKQQESTNSSLRRQALAEKK